MSDSQWPETLATAGVHQSAPGESPVETTLSGWEAIKDWRKHTRDELIRGRLGVPADVRRTRGESANQRLLKSVDFRKYPVLGIYWPIRGEIDVHEIAYQHIDAGGQVALPVIVGDADPVEFWQWRPGTPMQRGRWNIPIPRERTLLAPDIVIVPLVGFDKAGYRLGYGSGYYDRTLAAAATRPFAVGLGYAESELDTIHPQPHDIPMNLIVTDKSVYRITER